LSKIQYSAFFSPSALFLAIELADTAILVGSVPRHLDVPQNEARECLRFGASPLSTVFAGQIVGIREAADEIWLVSFMDYDLGFFDKEKGRVEPALNPFGPDKVLTMSPV